MLGSLAMGGYAATVWSAYGLVGSVLVFCVWSVRWHKQRSLKQLKSWFERQ